MDGDERAEEGSTRLRSDDECRLKISERLGERRSQPTQDARVGHHPVGSAAHRGFGRSPRHSNVVLRSRRNRARASGFGCGPRSLGPMPTVCRRQRTDRFTLVRKRIGLRITDVWQILRFHV
jgi:hypothetical protein